MYWLQTHDRVFIILNRERYLLIITLSLGYMPVVTSLSLPYSTADLIHRRGSWLTLRGQNISSHLHSDISVSSDEREVRIFKACAEFIIPILREFTVLLPCFTLFCLGYHSNIITATVRQCPIQNGEGWFRFSSAISCCGPDYQGHTPVETICYLKSISVGNSRSSRTLSPEHWILFSQIIRRLVYTMGDWIMILSRSPMLGFVIVSITSSASY